MRDKNYQKERRSMSKIQELRPDPADFTAGVILSGVFPREDLIFSSFFSNPIPRNSGIKTWPSGFEKQYLPILG
jgi:hypothetical protein